MELSQLLVIGQGLTKLTESFITNWIGPVFIAGVALYSLFLLKDRQFRQASIFAAIAVIVGLFVYFGKDLFGSGGSLTKVGKGLAGEIGNNALTGRIVENFRHFLRL